MKEYDGRIPEAEQLTRAERRAAFGRDFLRAFTRSGLAFSGTLDEGQRLALGIAELENYANETEA